MTDQKRDQEEDLRNQAPTADEVRSALDLASGVQNERLERMHGFRGTPPRPGSSIPRDDVDDDDLPPTTRFGGIRERP